MGQVESNSFKETVQNQVKKHKVLMYCTESCKFCVKAKNVFEKIRVKPFIINLEKHPDGEEIEAALIQITQKNSIPFIFIGGNYVGGYNELIDGLQTGAIQEKFQVLNIAHEEFSNNF